MRILFCCLLAAFLVVSSSVYAEDAPPLSEKEGKWSFSMNEPGADLKGLNQKKLKKTAGYLKDISGIVLATPAMTPPRGFEARFWGSISAIDRYDACTGKKCPPAHPVATLSMLFGRYEEKNGTIKAAFNTASTMDISINNLGHVFAHLPVLFKDDKGFLLPEPLREGERAGMTTYVNNGHAVSVITRNNTPLWLPVSRGRYLQAVMATTAKRVGTSLIPVKKGKKKPKADLKPLTWKKSPAEELKSRLDPAEEKKRIDKSRSIADEDNEPVESVRDRLQKLQTELAAMTPQEREMPARVDLAGAEEGQSPDLLPPDSSAGVAIVSPDFRYFNPKLSSEAIQLIVVQWKFDGNQLYDPEKSSISETLNNRKLLEVYKTMDWQKLRDKVTRTVP